MIGVKYCNEPSYHPDQLQALKQMQQDRTFFFLKQNVVYVQNDLKQNFIISDSARIIEKLQNNTV